MRRISQAVLLSAGLVAGLLTASTGAARAENIAAPPETLTATFTQPDGGVTNNAYWGKVLLHVTGVGQSYANVYNDAFYLYTNQFNPPRNGWDGTYYQLTFGTSPLPAFNPGSDAENFLIGPLPDYNPDHDYTFMLDTHLDDPGQLHFGVSDGGYSDNTGAYTITVTQLVADASGDWVPAPITGAHAPEPSSLLLLLSAGAPLVGLRLRRRG